MSEMKVRICREEEEEGREGVRVREGGGVCVIVVVRVWLLPSPRLAPSGRAGLGLHCETSCPKQIQ